MQFNLGKGTVPGLIVIAVGLLVSYGLSRRIDSGSGRYMAVRGIGAALIAVGALLVILL